MTNLELHFDMIAPYSERQSKLDGLIKQFTLCHPSKKKARNYYLKKIKTLSNEIMKTVLKCHNNNPDSESKTKLIEYIYEFASIYGEYYHNGDAEKILEKVSEKIELPEKFLEKHFTY